MRATPERDTNSVEHAGHVGMILMDVSFHALAIDNGATAILTALARDRRLESEPALPLEALIDAELRELMGRASRNSVHFAVGESAYTGRTYDLAPQNGFQRPLIVLYLAKEISAADSLGLTGLEYGLTSREVETLVGMVLGLTNKELAQRMDISSSTVKTFVRMVMAKMNVTKRAAVVAKVLAHITTKPTMTLLPIVACLLVCHSVSLLAQPSAAPARCSPPLCVSQLNDSLTNPLPGTLRYAVANAPAGAVITFDTALDGKVISLDTGSTENHLLIRRDLVIQGPAADRLTITGGDATRIFFIDGGSVRISGLTLAHGLAKGGDGGSGAGGGGGGGGAAGMGGAIYLNRGALTLQGVVVQANRAIGGKGGASGGGSGPGAGGVGGRFTGLALPGGTSDHRELVSKTTAAGDHDGFGGTGGTCNPGPLGGGGAGFGGGGGGGGSCGQENGNGGNNGFGGGHGGAGGFQDSDGTASFASDGVGGAGLGGAIFVRSGFVELTDVTFANNSAIGGFGAPESTQAPAKGGALFLCTPELCGSESGGVWSGNASFRDNRADARAGEGCQGRHDEQVCGRLSAARAQQFQISAPEQAVSGTSFQVVVTALDADGVPVSTYSGKVQITSSDRTSTIQADPESAPGTRIFHVVLQTAGSQTITASDASGASIHGSVTVEVGLPQA